MIATTIRILSIYTIFLSSIFAQNVSPQSKDIYLDIEIAGKKGQLVYIDALNKQQGGLIIVQGKQEQRFEYEILRYLRHQLPEVGWATLGVNIPNNHKNTNIKILVDAQIQKGIEIIKSKGYQKVYILFYGEDAGLFLSAFASENKSNLSGIILLSAYTKVTKNYDKVKSVIKNWGIPVFDIKAQYDFEQVDSDFLLRKNIFKRKKSIYQNLSLVGAEHDYKDSMPFLKKRIWGWMHRINEQNSSNDLL